METVHATFGTTDLGLAVFLAFNGCEEGSPAWHKTEGRDGRPQLEFRFANVKGELLSRFRNDEGGFQRYNGLRRHFLRIVHTELKENGNG